MKKIEKNTLAEMQEEVHRLFAEARAVLPPPPSPEETAKRLREEACLREEIAILYSRQIKGNL